jgi:large subunit ribosomal protein L5
MAAAKERSRLKSRYEQEIRPALIERFGYSTPMQAPVIRKITLNMGVGDAKQDTKVLEAATEQLATIAGQRPSVRRARKSIAAFKLREGMPVGVSVTLRGERSYEFLDRLMSVAIPRIRDFRGMNPRSFDGRGNYSMGVREQIIFPEIDYDSIDQTRGLDITITTSARTDDEAFALLQAFGFPFARDDADGGAGLASSFTGTATRNGGPIVEDAHDVEELTVEAAVAEEPPAVDDLESAPAEEAEAESEAPEAEAAPEEASEVEAAAEESRAEPDEAPEAESEPEAAPEPEPEAEAESESEPEAEAEPADAPAAEPADAPEAEPQAALVEAETANELDEGDAAEQSAAEPEAEIEATAEAADHQSEDQEQ